MEGTPCGESGRYIRFSSNFLSNPLASSEGSARILFNEWAKFKWGVFPREYAEPCTRFSRKLIYANGTACPDRHAARCVYKIEEKQSDQCKHCHGKSVQDVLRQHPDFERANLTVYNTNDILPSIQTFKRAPRRFDKGCQTHK